MKIKNVHRKKVTDEASGETNIVEEFHEIVNDDLEKFAKKPYAWRIMKKFVRDSGIDSGVHVSTLLVFRNNGCVR